MTGQLQCHIRVHISQYQILWNYHLVWKFIMELSNTESNEAIESPLKLRLKNKWILFTLSNIHFGFVPFLVKRILYFALIKLKLELQTTDLNAPLCCSGASKWNNTCLYLTVKYSKDLTNLLFFFKLLSLKILNCHE